MHCISRRTYRLPPPFPAPQRQSLREQSGIVRMLPGLRLCDSSDRALSPIHPYRRRTESDGIFRRGRILSAYVPCRFRKLRHIFLRQEYMRRPSAATARPSGTKTPRYPPACCRTVENRSAGSQALSGRNIPCTRRGCRPSAYLHRRTPVIRGPAPNAGTIHPVPDSRPPPRQYAPTKYPEMARTFGTQPTPPIPRSSRLPRNGGSRRSPVGRCKQAPPPRPPLSRTTKPTDVRRHPSEKEPGRFHPNRPDAPVLSDSGHIPYYLANKASVRPMISSSEAVSGKTMAGLRYHICFPVQ